MTVSVSSSEVDSTFRLASALVSSSTVAIAVVSPKPTGPDNSKSSTNQSDTSSSTVTKEIVSSTSSFSGPTDPLNSLLEYPTPTGVPPHERTSDTGAMLAVTDSTTVHNDELSGTALSTLSTSATVIPGPSHSAGLHKEISIATTSSETSTLRSVFSSTNTSKFKSTYSSSSTSEASNEKYFNRDLFIKEPVSSTLLQSPEVFSTADVTVSSSQSNQPEIESASRATFSHGSSLHQLNQSADLTSPSLLKGTGRSIVTSSSVSCASSSTVSTACTDSCFSGSERKSTPTSLYSHLKSIDQLQCHLVSSSQASALTIIGPKQSSSNVHRSQSPLPLYKDIRSVRLTPPLDMDCLGAKPITDAGSKPPDSVSASQLGTLSSVSSSVVTSSALHTTQVSPETSTALRYKFLFSSPEQMTYSRTDNSKELTTVVLSTEKAPLCAPPRLVGKVDLDQQLVTIPAKEIDTEISFIDDQLPSSDNQEQEDDVSVGVKQRVLALEQEMGKQSEVKYSVDLTRKKVHFTADTQDKSEDLPPPKSIMKVQGQRQRNVQHIVQSFCIEQKEVTKNFPTLTSITSDDITPPEACNLEAFDSSTSAALEDVCDPSDSGENVSMYANTEREDSSTDRRTSREIYEQNVKQWEQYLEAAATGKLTSDAIVPRKTKGIPVLPHPSSSFRNTSELETVKLKPTGVKLYSAESSESNFNSQMKDTSENVFIKEGATASSVVTVSESVVCSQRTQRTSTCTSETSDGSSGVKKKLQFE